MEFAVIGDVANRAARYCSGASPGDILISPDLYQWVWRMLEVEKITVPTKHEGELPAFRVKTVKLA
jgi:class 3 adenylate cyclase